MCSCNALYIAANTQRADEYIGTTARLTARRTLFVSVAQVRVSRQTTRQADGRILGVLRERTHSIKCKLLRVTEFLRSGAEPNSIRHTQIPVSRSRRVPNLVSMFVDIIRPALIDTLLTSINSQIEFYERQFCRLCARAYFSCSKFVFA